MSPQAAAIIFSILLGGLGLFQLALAAGAPLGRFAWGGGHERLPTGLRIGSLVAIATYAAFAVIVLERAGLIRVLPASAIASTGVWVVVAYLGLGVLVNAISPSRPERFTMTPLALALLALALLVALQAPARD